MIMEQDAALMARIRAIVMQLPDLEREVFLLHCVAELEYQEIARQLDITVGAVQSVLAKALAQIDRELGESAGVIKSSSGVDPYVAAPKGGRGAPRKGRT